MRLVFGGADGSKLCVTADLNGTTPTPGPAPKKGMCADGCLFNVVSGCPTEQITTISGLA